MADTNTNLFSEDDLIELSFLRDLETDELISAQLLGNHLQLSSPLDAELAFAYDELTLRIFAGPYYPALAVTWSVECSTLSRTAIIDLRARLNEIVEEASYTNNIEKWRERESDTGSGIYEPTMVVLSLVQETVSHIEAFRRKVEERTPQRYQEPRGHQPQLKQLANITESNSKGIERDTAFKLLGKTPTDIIRKIPPTFRVVHVEEVLRNDLVHAFQQWQEELRSKLLCEGASYLRRYVPHDLGRKNRIEDMVESIVKPHQTWHGTQRQSVPSIVRHGFLIPGRVNPTTKRTHKVRCGSTYGVGVYSSPDASFSLSYSGSMCEATPPDQYFGLKLIICATLMGRACGLDQGQNWRGKSETHSVDVDSYVCNRGLEYVVFESAQIVPVYVVHLDWGEDNAAHFADLPADPNQWVKTKNTNKNKKKKEEEEEEANNNNKLLLRERQKKEVWPDEARRAKQAIMARAAKWFPYGYGPATHGRFVVEEVGEVDDDEEEYGDYQALRGEEGEGGSGGGGQANMDFWSWVKAAGVEEEEEYEEKYRHKRGADEYGQERYAGKNRDPAWAPSWDSIPDPVVVLGHESSDYEEEEKESNDGDDDEGYGLERLLI